MAYNANVYSFIREVIANNTGAVAAASTVKGTAILVLQDSGESNSNVVTITNLTASGTTATAVTSVPTFLTTGTVITVSGAVDSKYNITAAVTVLSSTSFTYTIASGATSPDTGTSIKYTRQVPFVVIPQAMGLKFTTIVTVYSSGTVTPSVQKSNDNITWVPVEDFEFAPTGINQEPNAALSAIGVSSVGIKNLINPAAEANPTNFYVIAENQPGPKYLRFDLVFTGGSVSMTTLGLLILEKRDIVSTGVNGFSQ